MALISVGEHEYVIWWALSGHIPMVIYFGSPSFSPPLGSHPAFLATAEE